MKTEKWLPVVGYEDVYEVSDHGRIKRVLAGPGTWAGRLLKPIARVDGYEQIMLRHEGRTRLSLLHIIVAEAFIGPREGREVNHKNGIKNSNYIENLEYVTRQENVDHSINVLGRSNAGQCHGLSKFKPDEILQIRSRRDGGERLASIASDFNCSFQHVSDIANRRRWTHI